ncbi:phosphatase PAP2 family protein [Coralliovum pocilloporae]|uniref:phosphatase PAP2 family protein n=1 Tax=Coralliovum pocilloporae TaxID=3066369 RepID=UPI0033077D48
MTAKQALLFALAIHNRLWKDLGLLIGGVVRHPHPSDGERRFGLLDLVNYAIGLFVIWFVIAILFDEAAVRWARALDPDTRGFFDAITDIAKSGPYIALSAIAMICLTDIRIRTDIPSIRQAAQQINALVAFCFVCVAGSGLLVTLLKRLIGRARPKHMDEHGVFAFDPIAFDASFASFPSGHATTGVALAVVIAFLIPRLTFAAAALGITLAVSRVVVGAHYPSDILFGGLFALVFCARMRSTFAQRGWLFTVGREGTYHKRQGLGESWITIWTLLTGKIRQQK